MFVIHYHNEHAYDNPGMCEIYGPYPTIEEAKARLVKLVEAMNDPEFKIDPNAEAVDNDGTYAGFDWRVLHDINRDTDIAHEIWAEIVKLTPP